MIRRPTSSTQLSLAWWRLRRSGSALITSSRPGGTVLPSIKAMMAAMVFVPVKTEAQQGVLMLHRSRDLLVRQRTMLINALRAHLAEFGIVAAKGRGKVKNLIAGLDDAEIPAQARTALGQIAELIDGCDQHIETLEKQIVAWHKGNEASCNLATIPGIGPITASALAASVPDPSAFDSGRKLAAWLGLVPRQNSTGGKAPGEAEWLKNLLERKSPRLASVALANKMARIAWSVLTRGEVYTKNYRSPVLVAA